MLSRRIIKKSIHLCQSNGPLGVLVEILQKRDGEVLPGVVPEQQQPPHCNGRQWMKPSFSHPPTLLFARTLRLPSPPRWQWKVRLEETIPLCPRGGARMHRLSTAAAAAAAASSAIPAWEKNARRWQWEYTDEGLSAPDTHSSAHRMRRNGRDCYEPIPKCIGINKENTIIKMTNSNIFHKFSVWLSLKSRSLAYTNIIYNMWCFNYAKL